MLFTASSLTTFLCFLHPLYHVFLPLFVFKFFTLFYVLNRMLLISLCHFTLFLSQPRIWSRQLTDDCLCGSSLVYFLSVFSTHVRIHALPVSFPQLSEVFARVCLGTLQRLLGDSKYCEPKQYIYLSLIPGKGKKA